MGEGQTTGWTIRRQLLAMIAIVMVASALLFGFEQWDQRQTNAALKRLQEESLGTIVDLKALSDAYAVSAVDTTIKVAVGRLDPVEGRARIERLLADLDTHWRAVDHLSARQAGRLAQAQARRAVCDALLSRVAALMVMGDRAGLQRIIEGPLYPTIDPLTGELQQMVDAALQDAVAATVAEQARQRDVASLRLGLLVLMVLLLLLGARTIGRNVYRGVESLIAEARAIRRDIPEAERPPVPRSELGEVVRVMREMQGEIAEAEAQMQDALQQANDASRAKSVFVATMSHEIRTPLIGVTGMLEVLSHTALDGEQRRIIGVIEHSADALLQIIGDVLDFSKIEADRLSLDPEPVDLAALVRNVVANFEGTASSKGLRLSVHIAPSLGPAYWIDPLRLRQVLSNLMSNALKFTGQGGIDVAVDARPGGEAGDIVHLTVTDTGIGVTAEQVEKLFQPFTQAEGSTTRRFGGTGLGLAICKRIVEMMDGSLTMHGTAGVGTTVGVVLPLRRAPAEAVAVRRPAEPQGALFRRRDAPSIEDARQQGRLVLLADDHPTNREVITRQLHIAGYACETAVNGSDAFSRLQHGGYALLLTDLHMPGLDGLELARQWRAFEADHGLRRLPVIAISAAVTTEDIAACLAAGMDGHLPKPVPIAELAKILDSHLGAPPEPAPPVVAAPPHAPAAPPVDDGMGGLDPSVLMALTGGDEAVMREVLADFIRAGEADLAALDAALGEGREADAQREAHRLKGAARMVGATTLARLAGDAEHRIRHGERVDVDAIRRALRALDGLA